MKKVNFSTVLKWVGSATAILSLIFGIREIVKPVSERVDTHRKVDALLAAEEVELKSLDYAAAWRSLEQASQVEPNSEKIRIAQENVAMVWLEDVHLHEGEKYSDIAAKLEPVLTRGLASTKDSQRAGDLLAHIGWAYFLRSRDNVFGLDPASDYSQAVEKDPNNPYAQAMWGHLILWNHGRLSDASKHFSAGLVSGRHRDFVRRMQLAALFGCPNDSCDEEIIRVANDVRKENGKVDAEGLDKIFFIYYHKMLTSKSEMQSFLKVIPPAEHLATFRWLFDEMNLDEAKGLQRTCYLAELQEAAGQKEEALANYRAVRAGTVKYPGSLLDAANDGIKRVSTVR